MKKLENFSSSEESSRLNKDEVEKIIKDINHPNLSIGDGEYFIISFADKKTYVPKRTHIPVVQESGSIKYYKVEEYIRELLEK